MNFFKRSLFFLLLLTATIAVGGKGGNHTISTTIEITQTAINRYLNTQYNASGFPKTVPVSGTNYVIYLTLPEVILTAGNAKLQMVFDVRDGGTLLYHFIIQPSVSIPNTEITGANIEAFSTNLSSTLDAVSPALPSWVKTNILTAYNSLGWIVFPSKLADQVNTTWLAQRGINVVSPYFTLATEIVSGAFRFTVSTYLNSAAPYFSTYIYGLTTTEKIQFLCNIETQIVDVKVLPFGGSTLLWQGTPNVVCTKGGYVEIDMGELGLNGAHTCIVKAVFKTDNTWYSREFGVVPVNGAGPWYGPTKIDN